MSRPDLVQKLANSETDALPSQHPLTALIAPGDQLQSAAARMAEWINRPGGEPRSNVPYEVQMAALEAEGAIKAWTRARARP